jgi:insulysin
MPGLAHYCEHMCFLGSEKYPEENAYKKLLAAHGGKSNASTSMERTTYKFDVTAEHLPEVLDVFAQFFIAPTFTESGMGREVSAVDSEDSKNRTADGRRRLQIMKDIARPTPGGYSK